MKLKNKKGFTLIELLTIMVIIGILAGLLIPKFLRARGDADLSACMTNEHNMATAIVLYSNDNEHNFPADLANLTPNYLKNLPTCPSSQLTNSYAYQTDSDTDNFTIWCSATNAHLVVDVQTSNPNYDFLTNINKGNQSAPID